MTNKPNIQARTRREIANLLGISESTLSRKLKKHNVKLPDRVLVSPKWQKIIYDHLWYPNCYTKHDFAAYAMQDGDAD